ncbi:MAG: radical SAM protein [Elusimicrobiota bacterium]
MNILFIVKTIDFIDPQGIMLLSAIAKKKGHNVELGIMSREDILKKIESLKPQIIAYSASTGEHKYYLKINEIIKKKFPQIFTIMGGPHTTFFPESIKDSTFDAICVGEGDEAFPEVIEAVEKGKSVSDIVNIHTKEKQNPVRPLFENLDVLPLPDREIFYKTTEMGKFAIKSFMLSRGCPYNCTYCFNHAFRKLYQGKGKPVRRKSVEKSIEELLQVKSTYPLQFVKFYDDIFSYPNDPWLENFCRAYKDKVKLPFHCLTRANLVDENMVKLLKDAGCVSISMSIETGNAKLRNELLKRNMSDEQIYNAFLLFDKYGIKSFCNSILALPFSTTEDDRATIEMNIKCKVTFAEFPICHPYPGTELGRICQEKGVFGREYEKLHMSYQTRSPLNCFTEKEKNVQENLALLGTVIVWKPFLKKIVFNYLAYWPKNIFFFWAYLFTKMYLIKTKIYPFKLKPGDFWALFIKSIKVDKFKHLGNTE